MDDQTRIELEAAAFRTLREHLMDKRTDVQNIDMMNLAGFCRNCLSNWYADAAREGGIELGKDEGGSRFNDPMKTSLRSKTKDLACKLALEEPYGPFFSLR